MLTSCVIPLTSLDSLKQGDVKKSKKLMKIVNIEEENLHIAWKTSGTLIKLSRKITAQKMKFSIKNFCSKCDQISRFLCIWSHLLKKSLMENFIFCAADVPCDNIYINYIGSNKFFRNKRILLAICWKHFYIIIFQSWFHWSIIKFATFI